MHFEENLKHATKRAGFSTTGLRWPQTQTQIQTQIQFRIQFQLQFRIRTLSLALPQTLCWFHSARCIARYWVASLARPTGLACSVPADQHCRERWKETDSARSERGPSNRLVTTVAAEEPW